MPAPDDPQTREQALRRLLEDFARDETQRLRGVAWRSGARGEAIADAVQQGFLAFLRSYPGDPGDRVGAFSYLARAVQTSTLHVLRAERRHRRRVEAAQGSHDESGPDAFERALAADGVQRARELLAMLPEESRTIVFMRAAGYSPAEIAAFLGLTDRQLRKRVQRANALLVKFRAV